MDAYLIRHTAPDIEKGICYGQADVDVSGTFSADADLVLSRLPENIERVCSSVSMRCTKLAQRLFPIHPIDYKTGLQEIDCGQWELKRWSEIDPSALDHWMKNYETVPYPGGEDYTMFRERVLSTWEEIIRIQRFPVAIVTHGGVIRTILSHVHGQDLFQVDKTFDVGYGCVIKVIL